MNKKEIEQAQEVIDSVKRGDPPTLLEPVFPDEWAEKLSIEIQRCITRDGEEDPPGSIADLLVKQVMPIPPAQPCVGYPPAVLLSARRRPTSQIAETQFHPIRWLEPWTTKEPCGHFKNFMMGDDYGHFHCQICRAESAEREVGELRTALKKISDNYGGCHCDHTDENCCEKVGEFCPHCISEIALRGK